MVPLLKLDLGSWNLKSKIKKRENIFFLPTNCNNWNNLSAIGDTCFPWCTWAISEIAGFWQSGSFLLDGSWWNYNFFHPHPPQPDPVFWQDVLTHSFSCFITFFSSLRFHQSELLVSSSTQEKKLFSVFVSPVLIKLSKPFSDIKDFFLVFSRGLFFSSSWCFFPGLARQGSVNSARRAEVEGRPAGQ